MALVEVFAAIDLGSRSLRMALAGMSRRDFKVLENLVVSLDIGQDSFSMGKVSHRTLGELVAALDGFSEKMAEYDVTEYRAVATSALREAANRDLVLDMVRKRCDVELEVIEGTEETRLLDQRLGSLLHRRFGYEKGVAMLLSFGAGSCHLALRRDGQVLFTESHPLGTVRLRRIGFSKSGRKKRLAALVDSFVEHVAESLRRVHELGVTDSLFVVHEDLPRLLKAAYGARLRDGVVSVSRRRLEEYVAGVRKSPEKLALDTGLVLDDAETLRDVLLSVGAFLDLTKTRTVHFPVLSFTDALLYDRLLEIQGRRRDTAWLESAESAAMALGERYNFDRAHAVHVRKLCMRLFDQLADFCGLEEEDRPILNLAALLHDIGAYVNPRGHHKHSAYLIAHSEIMGLKARQLAMVAQVARYHRRAFPRPQHQDFQSLAPADRLVVRKLASILRMADALDRAHTQAVGYVGIELESNEIVMHCFLRDGGDFGVGQWALQKKAEMFEELFGVKVTCRYAGEDLSDDDEWYDPERTSSRIRAGEGDGDGFTVGPPGSDPSAEASRGAGKPAGPAVEDAAPAGGNKAGRHGRPRGRRRRSGPGGGER